MSHAEVRNTPISSHHMPVQGLFGGPPACKVAGLIAVRNRGSCSEPLFCGARRRGESAELAGRLCSHAAAGRARAQLASGKSGSGTGRRNLSFLERCKQLEQYQKEHGHTRVPQHEPSGLGRWVTVQRMAWKGGRLAADRQQQLAALGFCPDAQEEAWLASFMQLAAFHSQHGHCRVPRTPWADEHYPGLSSWLGRQQQQWLRGTLPDERRRRLQGLGCKFHARQDLWEARFEQLLDFKQEFGHTDVPYQWPRSPALANWVMTQRRRYQGRQASPLTSSQLSRLRSCGFRFAPKKDSWERQYSKLLELVRQRSSASDGGLACAHTPADVELSNWVAFQMLQRRRGRLRLDRAARLEVLGLFDRPSLRPQQWQLRVAALDALTALLGTPAAYALLVAAPAASAADMAADAVSRARALMADAGQPEDGSVATATEAVAGSSLTCEEAAAVVRWYKGLAARRVPDGLAQALQLRGLPVPGRGS